MTPKRATDADNTLRLALDARCLDAQSVDRIRRRKDQHISRRVRTADGITVRTLCPVSFWGRQQLADVVTGSLYDMETGRCLTGDRWLADDAAPTKKPPRRKRGTSEAQEAQGWTNTRRRAA
jgi:hypothetical protein